MDEKLWTLIDKLEHQRKQIMAVVSLIAPQQYYRSVNGKWSIAMILTHILTSEQLSLSYMKKKSLGIDTAGDTGWIESIKSLLLTLSQHLPFRFKAPKAVLESTPRALSFESLIQEWSASRTELIAFVETIERKHIRKKNL